MGDDMVARVGKNLASLIDGDIRQGQTKARGGRTDLGEMIGVGSHEFGRGGAQTALARLHHLVNITVALPIEPKPVLCDCFAYGPGVRGQIEGAHLGNAGRRIELCLDLGPVHVFNCFG